MRLTQTHDFFKYILPEYNCMGENQASEVQLEETDYTCKKYVIGEAIRQFGLIEDVLEKHKVESAEELDLILQELKDVHQENANLKNELAELKQKAIVPKFNVGDYFIEYWDNEPSIYQYKGNNHFECLNKTQGYHCDYIVLGALLLGEDFIKRISKEEAEQTLKKVGGENE